MALRGTRIARTEFGRYMKNISLNFFLSTHISCRILSRQYHSPNNIVGEATRLKVEALRSTYVKPHTSVGKKECQLTTYDINYIAAGYIQRLLIYRSDSKFEEVEENLKDGLRVVLEGFYPLAGKLGKDEEGILKLEYDDEMKGAEFKTAVAEDTQVEDMVDDEVYKFKEFVPCNDLSNLDGLYHPLFYVQLTKLKDGFALGCALNHVVVDGTSAWHFLRSWANRCNDPTFIPTTPFHDRTKARNTRVKLDLDPHDPRFITKIEPHMRQKIFSFSESTIDKIKSKTSMNSTGAKPFTTFHCIVAHLWHAITRARQLAPEDITVVAAFANLRHRLDPPMPETYFGNLIFPVIRATAAGVLYSSPVETTAALIQEAIEMLDPKSIDTFTTGWESKEPKVLKLSDIGGHIVSFGGSPQFKIYELDFGWGKPEKVMRCYTNRYDGMVFLDQGKNEGKNIDIDISLDNKAMERLEMDKDFLMHDV